MMTAARARISTLMKKVRHTNMLQFSKMLTQRLDVQVCRFSAQQAGKVIEFENGANCNKERYAVITQKVCKQFVHANEIPQDFIVHVKGTKEIFSVYHAVTHEDATDHNAALKERLNLAQVIHPDALEWNEQITKTKDLPYIYMKLSKIRLTSLIVITTIAGYLIAPVPFAFSTLTFATIGTGFTSCAANAINQFLEVPYDSQMSRTKARPLVKKQISELHAVTFAGVTATAGLAILATQVNLLTASLGLSNLLLYTCVYTPLKRHTIANTWVGAVVGAIPPVMGYTAATGSVDISALLLAGLLYAWQFPHFNALSWNLKSEYSRAGYRMMSVTAPDLCKKTALRYSVAIGVMCPLTPLTGLTTWAFAVDSLPPNLYLIYLAWKFYRDSDSGSSRKLFRFSLIHLPVLLTLLLLAKKDSKPSCDKGKNRHKI